MSREFGEYSSGYFHQKIAGCADDCGGSRHELTKLWGEFLREFYDVAYAISSHEACDSGAAYPIMESVEKLPVLRKKLDQISSFLRPYQDVMEEAVRKKTEGK